MSSNVEIGSGKNTERMARRDWLHPDSIFREYPDPGVGQYIADTWERMGRCMAGGYGPTPLTWQEVRSYAETVAPVTPWEAGIVFEMSRAYCQYIADTDRKTPAPYAPTDDEAELAKERGRQNEHAMRARKNG